ncbi:MAG: thiol oxidoreductase [Betaproteobacteria bacterium]|nr:thiol oxidoreductase [Betaproteobacteria bacterium]
MAPRRWPLPRDVARISLAWAFALAGVVASGNPDAPSRDSLTAGDLTTPESGPAALSVPVAMLDGRQLKAFADGKAKFHEAWVVAPQPDGVWGLGPTFNEDRCARCHVDNGRARAPAEGETAGNGYLVRLSIPGQGPHGAPLPHPAYGDQLQNHGTDTRVPAEGQVVVHYAEHVVSLPDGEHVSLRRPSISFVDLRFGPIGPDTQVSPRIAPAMIGMGLLEAVPEEEILEIAKSQTVRGVSGRPNRVWDFETETVVLGRFGWKASQPNVRQQTATAFLGDIGATTFMFPEENCPAVQSACLDLPSSSKCSGQGGCTGNTYRPEVLPSRLNNITFYLHALAVPARRHADDPAVAHGAGLFAAAGCDACHVPTLTTGKDAAFRALRNVAFHPYTDLLLHDMGDGLADGRPDFEADGREWRTAPLWGIGLQRTVSGHTDLLHDGRARNVTEAILWHDGEARRARDAFAAMTKSDRDALVRFVESL